MQRLLLRYEKTVSGSLARSGSETPRHLVCRTVRFQTTQLEQGLATRLISHGLLPGNARRRLIHDGDCISSCIHDQLHLQ